MDIENSISLRVHVESSKDFLLPSDASDYSGAPDSGLLYQFYVYGKGVQSSDDSFPVTLVFNRSFTDNNIVELKKIYEVGRQMQLRGEFLLFNHGQELEMTIFDPETEVL